jgi:hypothetical protein
VVSLWSRCIDRKTDRRMRRTSPPTLASGAIPGSWAQARFVIVWLRTSTQIHRPSQDRPSPNNNTTTPDSWTTVARISRPLQHCFANCVISCSVQSQKKTCFQPLSKPSDPLELILFMPNITPVPTLPWNYIAKLVCIGDSGRSSLAEFTHPPDLIDRLREIQLDGPTMRR